MFSESNIFYIFRMSSESYIFYIREMSSEINIFYIFGMSSKSFIFCGQPRGASGVEWVHSPHSRETIR